MAQRFRRVRHGIPYLPLAGADSSRCAATCWPSQRRLGVELEPTERTLHRLLRAVVDFGIQVQLHPKRAQWKSGDRFGGERSAGAAGLCWAAAPPGSADGLRC